MNIRLRHWWICGWLTLATAQPSASPPWVAAARSQVGETLHYDPAYIRLDYPGGDPPRERGVCTDVVIRALRASIALDLQRLVHEDMRSHFRAYPSLWGLNRPDRHIDHRRVPNLERFFARRGWQLDPTGSRAEHFLAGDLVSWRLPGNLPHIGIVSDRLAADGVTPLILHNVGAGAQEEDVLFEWPLTAQFRIVMEPARPP